MTNIYQLLKTFSLILSKVQSTLPRGLLTSLQLSQTNITKLASCTQILLTRYPFLVQFTGEIIERRRQNPNEEHSDMLSVMLTAKDDEENTGFTIKELQDETMSFFFAGHETTANTPGWAFYLFAIHPKEQEALRQEIRDAMGDTFQIDVAKNLKGIKNAIKETLRMFPTVPLFPRLANEATELGGIKIPKGGAVFISGIAMAKNPTLYPEPEVFDPQRWDETSPRFRNNDTFAFIPFGGGPRVCIGQRFAMQ